VAPRPRDSVRDHVGDRLRLVGAMEVAGLSASAAGRGLGYSAAWGRRWWHRYQGGGAAALAPPAPVSPGPLATFAPAVRAAVLNFRRTHPRLGARRAVVALAADPPLAGQPLPSWRTVHRAWVAAGLVVPRLPRDAPPPAVAAAPDPADPHAVWQIDHQDHLRLAGLAEPVVLQGVRAPAAGLVVGADLFPGARGAPAVPLDDVLDALRRCFARWGLPGALSVDGGTHFLGQAQRQFPSRLELFCAGLGVPLAPIRPRHPTDHGAIERQHRTLDDVLLGPPYPDLAAAQAALDAHVALLNRACPSRAKACRGQPPLTAHPAAAHSGRPYDPAQEAATFDLAAVDAVLAGWTWHRRVGATTGQVSFGHRNVGVGLAWAGQAVVLRFDPTDRMVVVRALGAAPGADGPELKRFACPAFTAAAIRGHAALADPPPPRGTDPPPPYGT
jgi:hypothetical protein